jgi:hypothetical protein
MTPAGIEPATFRFVAQQLNHWSRPIRWFKISILLCESVCTLLECISPVLTLIFLQQYVPQRRFCWQPYWTQTKKNDEGIFAFIPQCVYFNTEFFVRRREDHFLVVLLFNPKLFFSSLVQINSSNLTRFTYLAESPKEQRIFLWQSVCDQYYIQCKMNCVRWSHEQSDSGICAALILEKKIRHRSCKFSWSFCFLVFVYRLCPGTDYNAECVNVKYCIKTNFIRLIRGE